MMPDIETVITHLQIIHTWAEFAREHDLQFFTPKHLEDIAQWSSDAIVMIEEQKQMYFTLENDWRMCRDLLKEQEQKIGHWVEQQINSYTRSTTCSVCGGSAPFVFVSADRYGRYGCGKDELTKYCPNCGAEMKGETEVEID